MRIPDHLNLEPVNKACVMLNVGDVLVARGMEFKLVVIGYDAAGNYKVKKVYPDYEDIYAGHVTDALITKHMWERI